MTIMIPNNYRDSLFFFNIHLFLSLCQELFKPACLLKLFSYFSPHEYIKICYVGD